jgi:hypothetical protein
MASSRRFRLCRGQQTRAQVADDGGSVGADRPGSERLPGIDPRSDASSAPTSSFFDTSNFIPRFTPKTPSRISYATGPRRLGGGVLLAAIFPGPP